MKRVLLVAIASISALACGASSHQRSPVSEVALPSDAPVPPPKALAPLPDRHAKLTFTLGTIAPLPFVHGTIGGKPTWMIVDSGAGTQFVTSWMASRASVKTSPTTTTVSDHVRRDVNVTLADRSLIVIEGWGGLTPGELLVVDEAEHGLAAKFGVGVVLSPQELENDRAVIVELDRGSLRTGSEDDAASALATRKIAVDSDEIKFCHGVFSVAARIDGHAVRLGVDTGASSSDLFSLSDAGRELVAHSSRSRSGGEAASGPVAMHTAKGVRIQMGGLSVRRDVDILTGAPEIECPVDGVLGIDVLRSCVLVFGSEKGKLRIRCNEKQ